MKGGPSIAVMLGGAKHYDDEEAEGDLSLSETKARAEDAAVAFQNALDTKNPRKIVAAFCSLSVLCNHLDELEESGEKDDERDGEVMREEPEETEDN